MIGAKLSHFEITAHLGEGGMGAVYRAVDTKLGREVAIKVLPAAFTEDAERLARFEREARVLAALEHPNIAGIYEVGSGRIRGGESADEPAQEVNYLAMQLAAGEDLASRLERGPMPVDEALAAARQIADALEAAHARGIVHRDLKPANIMLGPDGGVKVLDFGLAKAWEDAPGASSDLTRSPTLTAQMTQAGIILGTAGYMSPEQARGQEADRRSDIWSFGVVLWEMLTGARLFAADTVSDTLARVLMAEPDWEEVDADVPAPIGRLLRRCLERDVKTRLQAIGEARIQIDDYLSDPAATAPALAAASAKETNSEPVRPARAAKWILLGAAIGAALAVGVVWQHGAAPREGPRYAVYPPVGSLVPTQDTHGVAISSDGHRVAFVAQAGGDSESLIYLKSADTAEARPIPGTEGARIPFFSPDGQWIGYFTDRELRKISLAGGSSLTLTPTADRRGAVWHPDGTIYFVPHSAGPVVRISSNGGLVDVVTRLDEARRERTHRWPALLPDGSGLVYTSDTYDTTEYYDDARIETIEFATGEQKVLVEGSSRASFSPTGDLLFARDGALYAVGFDPRSREIVGSPTLAVPEVFTIVASGAVEFGVAEDGTLAYIPGGKTSELFDLLWVSPEGELTPASSDSSRYFQVAMSPSGQRAVVSDTERGGTDLWMLDLERDTLTRFTFEGNSSDPVWTPGGEAVIFASDQGGDAWNPYRKAADGGGEAELLWDAPREATPLDVSPDGRWLAVGLESAVDGPESSADIWIVDLTGEALPYPFLDDDANTVHATFSSDGRFVAYVSDENDSRQRIYVRPFPPAPGKWQVSTVASTEPRWSPDGRRLYYRTSRGMRFVPLESGDGFRFGREQEVDNGRTMGPPFNMTYSLARDGRLLIIRSHDAETENWSVHVIHGWTHELERLLGR